MATDEKGGSAPGWRRHFTSEMMRLEHPDPSRFAHGPWRRERRVSAAFLAYRLTMSVVMLATLGWGLIVQWRGGKWLIYLTNWGYTLVAAQAFAACAITLGAYRSERCSINGKGGTEDQDSLKSGGMPLSYKAYWVLYNIAVVIAPFISAVYWIFVFEPEHLEEWQSVNYTFHIWNFVASMLEVGFGGPPTRVLHFVHPFSFGLLYLTFNVIYGVSGGTDAKGNPYIYKILDWNRPTGASITAVGSAIFMILLHFVVAGLAGLRHRLSRRLRGGGPLAVTFQAEPLSAGKFNKAFVNDAV